VEEKALIKEVLSFGEVFINFDPFPMSPLWVTPSPPCAVTSLMDAPQ